MSADEPTWSQPNKPTELVTEAAADPATPGPLGRRRKILTAAAVVGGVALTGGVALAASHGGSATKAQQAPGQQGGPSGGSGSGFGGAFGGPGRGLGAAIHGEYVVETSTGTYVTELTQRGTVSAVSSTSVTVKSADGYSKTYVVPSSVSVTSVKTGDTVSVVATVSGSTATLTSIGSGTGPTGQPGAPAQGGAAPTNTS